MTMVEWVRVLAGVALFSVWVVTGLVAQPDTDSPQRVEQRRADLSGAPRMEVIASTAEYKPEKALRCTCITASRRRMWSRVLRCRRRGKRQ